MLCAVSCRGAARHPAAWDAVSCGCGACSIAGGGGGSSSGGGGGSVGCSSPCSSHTLDLGWTDRAAVLVMCSCR